MNKNAHYMMQSAGVFCSVQVSQLLYVANIPSPSRTKLEALNAEVGPIFVQCAIDMGYITADGDKLAVTAAGLTALPVLLDLAARITKASIGLQQREGVTTPGLCPNCGNAPILSPSTNLCGPCLMTSGRRQ